ncbi:FAD/NAD(P)-binding protein [Yoonia sp. MH D7]
MRDTLSNYISTTHLQHTVIRAAHTSSGWMLFTQSGQHGPYDEILLSQGQPETTPDKQLQRWTKHAHAHALTLMPAYPVNALIAAAADWNGKTVAVRGLGLSTFDVLRALTEGTGGTFSQGKYTPSGNEPRKILPFSLNGQPPAAKPATAALDAKFDPLPTETRALQHAIEKGPVETICTALIEPTLRILQAHNDAKTAQDITRWLAVEREDPGAQNTRTAYQSLTAFIAMAHGRISPSIGYVIGQIWRKWQTEIRDGFNTAGHPPDTAAAIIAFDEGLKRYSYGPPVSAAEQLLALIDLGLVTLGKVDDPAIMPTPDGWSLSENDDETLAHVMIDAVLPAPCLHDVSDPLLCGLQDAWHMAAVTDDLGAQITCDGHLTHSRDAGMLGRLTLGSVIAVDSLHDCFGSKPAKWAQAVIAKEPMSATTVGSAT